ncbi:unnamed protein product [Rhizophagus irregularis]|nr:unnamed protein product [Rhizophagus irregularis]
MFDNEWSNHFRNKNPTVVIKSSDIGPVTVNPGAIYKSRPLSGMIRSAIFTRSLRSQSINLGNFKRKFEDNDGQSVKRIKLFENENNDYLTKEFELDIDVSFNNNEYITKEFDFDINNYL